MTEQILTRQQKRALTRQKYHKHIAVDTYYINKTPRELLDKHPIVDEPMFEVVKVIGVLPLDIKYQSAFGMRGSLLEQDFSKRFRKVAFKEIEELWNRNLSIRESIKGQTISAEDVFTRLREMNPDFPIPEELQTKE